MHTSIIRIPALLFLILASCQHNAAPPTMPLASPLAGLALRHDGRPMHEGSWDRTGGNADMRAVAPGQTITLLDHNGAGIIRRFWVTIAPRAEMHIHRQAILRMYWDGETNPSVECPIGDFFGVGFGEQKDFISLPLNETSGGYNCYWPMPFHKSARWTLTNLSDRKIDAFYYNIDYTAMESLPDDLFHFRAQWRRENPTSRDRNYTILETAGEGHFVGTALFMQARKPRGIGFLEGDEMISIDGEQKPSIIGTGTEDYFSSGWYFDRGTYSAPFHGVVIKDERQSRISAYRWHIEDAMPYRKSIKVTIEHGTNNDVEADYSSVAYYYESGRAPARPDLPKDLLPGTLPEAKKISGAIEGEDLIGSAKASSGEISVQQMDAFPGEYSGGAQLWWRPERAGETLTIELPVKDAGEYNLIGHFTKAADYAQIEVKIGDAEPTKIDLYHDGVIPSGAISLGKVKLRAGKNLMTITTTGKNQKSSNYLIGLDAIELKPAK
jgi:hypothetical protein